jgi:hypothetical protein
MRCAFGDAEKASYPIVWMCQLLGVPRSTFYAWRSRAETATAVRRRELAGHVRRVFNASRGTYGCRRVTAALNREGHPCSVGLVADLMRESGRRRRAGPAARRRRAGPAAPAFDARLPHPGRSPHPAPAPHSRLTKKTHEDLSKILDTPQPGCTLVRTANVWSHHVAAPGCRGDRGAAGLTNAGARNLPRSMRQDLLRETVNWII